jgi:hypothetical protein
MDDVFIDIEKNFYTKIFYENSKEFEKIRGQCLEEKNWLRSNYLPKNLDITKYFGFAVSFDVKTDEPVSMAGVFNYNKRYPEKVAQHLHRMYVFPKYRRKTYKGLVSLFEACNQHIVKPLNKVNNFDLYFVAMQNRYKKPTVGYWKVFSKALCEGMPNWVIGEGLIQTCTLNVQKCWQNYCYLENKKNMFIDWNPKIIELDEWKKLKEGK